MACNLDVSFTVPGPVVPWQRAASVGARRFTPAKQRAYQATVRYHALAARPRGPWLPSKASRYRVDVEAFLPDERRRDLDNVAKTILDALNGVLYLDDSQITTLLVATHVDRERPRVEVRVVELERVEVPKPRRSRPTAATSRPRAQTSRAAGDAS
jgi:Holliday junction resolvase RusA-like endonuclease